MTHFTNLMRHVPDLEERAILDVGAGRGEFLIEAAQKNNTATGIEINPEYIGKIHSSAKEIGMQVNIVQGKAENLPFPNKQFGFVNASELIEHVHDPKKVFEEIYRVLVLGGYVYTSVPNRFGIKDPHFHLYFVNWLPRVWANVFISIFGEHKEYVSSKSGLQNLAEMHYFTYQQALRFFQSIGFSVCDMRVSRIKREFPILTVPFLLAFYHFLRPWYFDTFHFLLERKNT